MEEQFYKIIFIGELEAGKTAIVNAIMQRKIVLTFSTMGMTFQNMQLEVQQQNLALQICDTSGAKRCEDFVINECKNAHVICLVVNATQKPNLQKESIAHYQRKLAEKTKKPISLLLIANHRQKEYFKLSESDLASVGITPNNYLLASAEQIIKEKSANQRSVLEVKIAERLVGAHPICHPSLNAQANQRTCSFWPISSIKWLNTYFNPKPPSTSIKRLKEIIVSLSQEQVQIILQSIHHRLKKGTRDTPNKPYAISWFGWGGTRNGAYWVSSPPQKIKAVFFESKVTYPNDVMRWLSLTMVSINYPKIHTEDECKGINLHLILAKLYENILNTNNSFTLKLRRESDSTLAFYKDLPHFIEEEIKRVQGINNNPLSPLLSVNRRTLKEQHI